MSKLILRSSNVNVNYTVESITIDTTIGSPIKDVAEVIIRPKPGYNVKAENFISGVLPAPIYSISYYNVNNNVIARIEFDDQPINNEIINIYLPISGNLKRLDNTLVLTDVTVRDDNVLETTSSIGIAQSTNIYNGSAVYKVSTRTPGLTIVLSKTLSVPNGFYFEEEPTYNIDGNNSRYKVSINVTKNDVGRIIKKSFDISYNFPVENPVVEPQNTIKFIAQSKPIEVDQRKITAEVEKDYKIYNVDYGRTLGLEGGTKHIKVNGVPGTKFKVLIQDTDKKIYDFKSGGFQTNASFLEGTIPAAESGFGFGTFNAFVNVAASTTATTISTNIITVAPTSSETTDIIPTTLAENMPAEFTMTLELIKDSVAYVVTRPALESEAETLTSDQITDGVSDGTYAVTALTDTILDTEVKYYEGSSNYYIWYVTCADDKAIGINRQPQINTGSTYVNWDSAYSEESAPIPKLYNNAGTIIKTDVDNISELSDWGLDMEISVGPTEDSDILDGSDWAGGHTYVYKKLKIIIATGASTAGTANINPELNLDNFLTLI